MKLFRPLVLAVLLAAPAALVANDVPHNAPANAPVPDIASRPALNKQTRLEIIRAMTAEYAFSKKLFPKGGKGLVLNSNGEVSPDDKALSMQVATYGPAAKPGDRVQITAIDIRDKSIVFELNGGPKKKGHWYDHVSVGMGGAEVQHQEKNINAKGSYLTLEFPKHVPEMTADDLRKLLEPVFDFTVKSPTQAYLDTLPPRLKESIENHEVLVGMTKDMVIEALGRPPKRLREREGDLDYEEWIFGEPPADVQFVRFVNEEVVRVEKMPVGGEKEVKTAREVKVNPVTGGATMVGDKEAAAAPSPAADGAPDGTKTAQSKKPPAKPPSMKRPGEEPVFDPTGGQKELGSKPIPAPGQQEPEWGTKPATQPSGTTPASTQPGGSPQDASSPSNPH
jgi:hypothetical protein